MAMVVVMVFFFFQFSQVKGKWKDFMLVFGFIIFIVVVYYFYMRDFWVINQVFLMEFCYIDWILIVFLMCVEFYFILCVFGVKVGLFWKMIFYLLVMLVVGYFGEIVFCDQFLFWGFIFIIGYVGILYEVWFGFVKCLFFNFNDFKLQKGFNVLVWFVFVGWVIYLIGYMIIDIGWLVGVILGEFMDIIYNIGDVVNKIGFGLVIYLLVIFKLVEGLEEFVGVGVGKMIINV